MSGSNVGDWSVGVGVNATWDLIKAIYSKIKSDLDRQISSQQPDFEFDWLDKIINNTLDILAGAGTNRISQLSNVLHQWLVNVPDEFLRQDVRRWLESSAVRRDAKSLMAQLLSGENIDELKTSLVRSFCEHTESSVVTGDMVVRIVIKFIGDTIEGSISDGERVLLAKAQSTHAAVQVVHESIIQLEQRLMEKIVALPVQGGQVPSLDDQRLLRAFRISQKAEGFLRDHFRAHGNGLGELLRSVSVKVRNFDPSLAIALEKFAPVRNLLIHEQRPPISAPEIEHLLDEVDTILQRHLPRPPAETSLALPSRQWFVSGDGFGEFTSISEALSHSAAGDHIFILPGSYHEKVCIEKTVFLFGKGESAGEVIITTNEDLLEIGARDVVVSNLTFETQHPHAFGAVLLPGSDRIVVSQCGFAVPKGEGLVALHATGVTISECRFEHCRVGVRLDSNAVVTQCTFAQNDHGLLVRSQAVSTIEKCSFRGNQIDLELQDGASTQVHDNEFQAGSYAIVAEGQPTGRIFSNRFSGYDPDSRLIRMHDAQALVFDE